MAGPASGGATLRDKVAARAQPSPRNGEDKHAEETDARSVDCLGRVEWP